MSRSFRIALIVLCVVCVPVSVVMYLLNMVLSWQGGLIGLVGAIIYTALILVLLRLSPMWPRGGGPWWIITAYLWGGAVATSLALIVASPPTELASRIGLPSLRASFGGAYPEEFGKALGVFFVLLSFRHLTRPWHGLITGAIVGLGFEAYENGLYGAMGALFDANSDVTGTLHMWILRLILGPCLHITLTSMIGWAIGWALFGEGMSMGARVWIIVRWWALAFTLHFCWNIMWDSPVAEIAGPILVSLVLYPTVVWLFWRGNRMARSDEPPTHTPGLVTTTAQLAAWQSAHGIAPAGLVPGDGGKDRAGDLREILRS
ncbi:PrsW family intramembrane metalloprotease [Corynebacterium uberis]|uniref:PrsW family intramembrane metalloprotease n=1 Tax=Corynebacterium TaxID=1716 RepID=UPI001D0AEEED|nr:MULTISPECIES: PrsW family intramembrane metalloprotease [Corynebacterium]MCZ9309867.1 PrsW family intramembrane metalloprotease [Corynebacterium sp. c6VSa_13]UDL73208.1 PrsW family intramembrane metalloprotease [Corynebacterium uberis]UDL75915.1 PrsW family intramembrane metalloprotease [Corynebacterium uberis]UDL78127.1 PrsW family intramembrane metalloprotease [Corynebacterium uberis]UDL80410.1 PrsW family intramembrane metalloprotease [Corynebacterium uberis]